MALTYEPQVSEKEGKFYMTVTIGNLLDQYTTGLAELKATSWEDARTEALEVTWTLANLLKGTPAADEFRHQEPS
jgi:hypothetical protein